MINYKVLKQYLKLSYKELQVIRFISCGASKAYNLGIENIKNHYEKDKTYIGNYDNFDELRHDEISKKINADINGSLNILCKSSVCGDDILSSLRCRGVNTPVRLQVI